MLFSDGSYALKDVPDPVMGKNVFVPQDVLIEVGYCGICGSDVTSGRTPTRRNGGRILISGGGIRGGIMAQLDTRKIVVKELELYGEISHVWTSWKTAIKLVSQGKVKVRPLVSHIYPLDKWEEAFDLAATSPEVLRVAINPRA